MGSIEVIQQFKDAVQDGEHWYIALLKAVSAWTEAEEDLDGRVYRYVIGGEAFDWLLLAERLCESLDGLLPQAEKEGLVFRSRPPLDLPQSRFRELMGGEKYHQFLNYFYGITVEEALVQAVREEVRKEKRSSGFYEERDYQTEAYRRIYHDTPVELLKRFRKERKFRPRVAMTLSDLKEFTYWRFKYRFTVCDRAKVASDTKKALDWLVSKGACIPGVET